jgi:hypothetical protein
MGSRTDPLSTLRAAIQASRDEIRNGLAAFEAARGLREDKAVVARINTTRFAGHAANAIDRACTLDALMSAARLWDSGDCRVCRNILFQLQVGSVQKAIERLVVPAAIQHSKGSKGLAGSFSASRCLRTPPNLRARNSRESETRGSLIAIARDRLHERVERHSR